MKPYCRCVASRNVGTRQKTTHSPTLCVRATCWAWRRAQLSWARWSRDIQYTTPPDDGTTFFAAEMMRVRCASMACDGF